MKSVVEGEELSHMVAGVWPLRVTMATMVNVIIFNQARGGGGGGRHEQASETSLEATI